MRVPLKSINFLCKSTENRQTKFLLACGKVRHLLIIHQNTQNLKRQLHEIFYPDWPAGPGPWCPHKPDQGPLLWGGHVARPRPAFQAMQPLHRKVIAADLIRRCCAGGRGRIWARYQRREKAKISRACRRSRRVGRHLAVHMLKTISNFEMTLSQDWTRTAAKDGAMTTP
jgi:hypothetical protein